MADIPAVRDAYRMENWTTLIGTTFVSNNMTTLGKAARCAAFWIIPSTAATM